MLKTNSGHFTIRLGANMIEYASEMDLYIISATLKVFMVESDNFNHEISASQIMHV